MRLGGVEVIGSAGDRVTMQIHTANVEAGVMLAVMVVVHVNQ